MVLILQAIGWYRLIPHHKIATLVYSTFQSWRILINYYVKDKAVPTIIFMHHPPISLSNSEPPEHEYENLRMIKNFAEIVDRHPQIIAFLCGHIHRAFSSHINASPIMVIPPLAKKLYRGAIDHSQLPEISFRLHSFKENAFTDTTVVTVN